MIVDFRIRPPYRGFTDLHIFRPRDPNPDPVKAHGLSLDLPEYKSRSELSMTHLISEMDEAGIDVGVVHGRQSPPPFGSVSADTVAAIVEEYPGRFVGFGGVDGTRGKKALEEIERCHSLGLRGISFDNGFSDPPLHNDDPQLMSLYQLCDDLNLIVSLTSSIFLGPDLSYCHPIHIQRVALAFPGLTIVVPHAAWPWTTLACSVVFQCNNVHLIPDFYLNMPNTPGSHEYVRSANYFMSYNLLFGSSYPVRPFGQSVEQFRALPFDSDEIVNRALGENAARILGI